MNFIKSFILSKSPLCLSQNPSDLRINLSPQSQNPDAFGLNNILCPICFSFIKQSIQYIEYVSNSQSRHFQPPSPRIICLPHLLLFGMDIDFK